MPNFKKSEAELETRLDKWLYFIQNLEDFQSIPIIFKDEVFTQAFEKAEIAKYNQVELDSYESSLKVFRDNKATFDYAKETAYNEGIADGIKEGELKAKLEIAKTLKANGVPIELIILTTKLSKEEIEKL